MSTDFHQQGIPVLLSANCLRRYGCGQIDLARFHDGVLELLEVKCRPIISKKQERRLRKSVQFLHLLFNCSISLKFVSRKDRSNDCQKREDYLSFYL